MKKKLVIVSLLVLIFCLSGCAQEKPLPENFNYNNCAGRSLVLTNTVLQLNNESLEIYSHDGEEYFKKEDLAELYIEDAEVLKSACSGTLTARGEAGEAIQAGENTVQLAGDITYELSGTYNDIVTIIIPVQFTDYAVNYEYTFEPNPKAEYNPFAPSYIMTQAVVSTQYSKAELMQRAGMNTLMGMGVVFVVLIFICFIIGLFKYMPGSGAKKQDKKKTEAAKTTEAAKSQGTVQALTAPKETENLMDNQELVAIITAAVIAANGSASNRVSSDQLIVRSIKRASR